MSIPTPFKSAIACVLVMSFCSVVFATAEETVSITFKVKPAPGTPADEKLYLAGDAKALGGWKADGAKLTRGDDGIYSGKVDLPRDKQIEYKVTRGSWETVEKNADGSEMNNRTLTPTKDATVEIEVKKWADAAKVSPGSEKPAEKKSTRIGDIRVHTNFHSRTLGNDRDVLVYVPMVDDPGRQRRFPVLYMHDGQNVFDAATSFAGVEWKADETATRLILNAKIEPLIIVAIASTPDRIDEYTLYRDEQRKQGGNGRAYMKFVAEELKPFIDKRYPTRPGRADTGVGGSSLGGTISLEICRAYPEQFGKCIAMSPALWWADYELLRQLRRGHDSNPDRWMSNCRFWIDMGSKEGDTEGARLAAIGALQQLEATLDSAGLEPGVGYRSVLAPDARHSELFWASRLEGALTFLYPPPSTTYNTYDEPPASPATPAPDPAAPHDVAAR